MKNRESQSHESENLEELGVLFFSSPAQDLRNQGISRLLIHQLKGLGEALGQIRLFAPFWLKKNLVEIARDQGACLDNVIFVCPRPLISERVILFFVTKLKYRLKTNTKNFVTSGVSLNDNSIFFEITIAILITTLISLWKFTGLILILLGILFAFLIKKLIYVSKVKFVKIGQEVYGKLIQRHKNALIVKIEEQGLVMLTVSPHQDLFQKITNKKLLIVPDMVNLEYPFLFFQNKSESEINKELRRLIDTIKCADRIITYSNHVKNKQVLPIGSHSAGQVHVVPNAGYQFSPIFTEGRAKLELPGDYLFCPTQVRPYKNLENLISALYIVNKRLRADDRTELSIVFTGKKQDFSETLLNARILDLQDKILVLDEIDGPTMNFVYSKSIASIFPSWHEGGFLYPQISESWGNSAPTLFALTPANSELIDTHLCADFMFDPSNSFDISRTILRVMDDRESLLIKQKELLNVVMKRNWQNVAREYLESI